ncbi:MAG TPA: glycosyltransferase [Bryobacteraceae bacterium]
MRPALHNKDIIRICLIVPCYNEAQRLNLGAFRQFLMRSAHTHILFIDDGSYDNTVTFLENLTAEFPSNASLLRRPANQGKAEAVRAGIIHAIENFGPEIVGFWDADLATPLDLVPNLLAVLDTNPSIEMVFGARVQLLGRRVERRAVRHYLGRVFATAVSTMLHLAVYDTQCGAKLFRVTPETPRIFGEPFLSRWVFDVEILARYLAAFGHDVRRLEQAVYEYPLEVWTDIAGSKVHASDFFTAFWDVYRIHRKYL